MMVPVHAAIHVNELGREAFFFCEYPFFWPRLCVSFGSPIYSLGSLAPPIEPSLQSHLAHHSYDLRFAVQGL